jgi:hypothetical protein
MNIRQQIVGSTPLQIKHQWPNMQASIFAPTGRCIACKYSKSNQAARIKPKSILEHAHFGPQMPPSDNVAVV